MRKIPWKGIAIGCLVASILVVARSVVTVCKARYYGFDPVAKLAQDPWFYVGILTAALGIVTAVCWMISCGGRRSAEDPGQPISEAEQADELCPEELRERI